MAEDKQQATQQEMQDKIQNLLKKLSEEVDFKEYFKVQREINQDYIGTWQFVDVVLKDEPKKHYQNLLESFGKKAEIDKENKKPDKKKEETIDKFNEQILGAFEKNDYEKVSQQLFYVLLGNVLDHIGKADANLEKFDMEKDFYPHLKMPLSLVFFLFQNLTFGPISPKVNELSEEYLNKYFALFLGLWRSVFDIMVYEKRMEQQVAHGADEHVHDENCNHDHKHTHEENPAEEKKEEIK